MQLLLTFNLRFYNLATVLATFLKIGQFFQISGHSAKDKVVFTTLHFLLNLRMGPISWSIILY